MLSCSSLKFSLRVNVCVLGGGPGGIAAALRASELGKSVCLIEGKQLGGADYWNGALQSKTMWEMAKFSNITSRYRETKSLELLKEIPAVRHENIHAALHLAAKKREDVAIRQLEAAKVRVIYGKGTFRTANAVAVEMNSGRSEVVESDYVVIATGARPRAHPTAVADGQVVLTSDDIMTKPIPKSLVIIGAGVIGCEFATIYANLNQTQVNVIEKNSRMLPMEDDDVAELSQNLLERRGVHFHHQSALVDNAVVDGKFHYTLKNLCDGELHNYVVDHALVSIGRVPNVESIGLENVGVQLQNGRLPRDKVMRVAPHKNIYACGDVSTRIALVNVAELEARACVEHMYLMCPEEQHVTHLDNLSTIMFLDEEVAAVGLNEKQCRRQNIGYKMAKYCYGLDARALVMGLTDGFVKLLVTNDSKMQMLGARAVGPHASSIIEMASLAIHNRESVHNLGHLQTAYPTLVQGFQECILMLLGSSKFKPRTFPQLVLSEWNPPDCERGRAYIPSHG